MSGYKYGLLGLDEVSHDDAEFEDFDGEAVKWVAELPKLVDPAELQHWKEWIGSVEWDQRIAQRQRLLVLRRPAEHPGDLDHDNVALTERLDRAWFAWMVPPPNRPWGYNAWTCTGPGAGRICAQPAGWRSAVPSHPSGLAPVLGIAGNLLGSRKLAEAWSRRTFDRDLAPGRPGPRRASAGNPERRGERADGSLVT